VIYESTILAASDEHSDNAISKDEQAVPSQAANATDEHSDNVPW